VYTDDAISGAEFVKRPGFVALMNALAPPPPFQARTAASPSTHVYEGARNSSPPTPGSSPHEG